MDEYGLEVVDAGGSITEQQRLVRALVAPSSAPRAVEILMSNLPEPADRAADGGNGIQPGRYYGRGIPYLPMSGYPGKLIAIEGTDGVGRSTQIQLLREWLEVGATAWSRPAGHDRP